MSGRMLKPLRRRGRSRIVAYAWIVPDHVRVVNERAFHGRRARKWARRHLRTTSTVDVETGIVTVNTEIVR